MRGPDADAVKAAADRAEARSGGSSREAPRGRGRLSSIDQLPEEAQEDVLWAVSELNKRQQSQDEIRFEFNERIARKGLDEVSRSAFNRYSLRHAALSRRLDETHRIIAAIAPRFTPDKVDENTVAIGEFIKLLVFEIAQSEGHEIGAKGAMELARAHLAVIQGQKISADRRRKLEADFKAGAEKAVEQVAHEKGISGETVTDLKRALFQVRPEASGGP